MAFQKNTFQPNAFQEGGVAKPQISAFEPGAFQQDAFQTNAGVTSGSKVDYTLILNPGVYLYTGSQATLAATGVITGHSGGDDGWKKEKKRKKKDEYAEATIARKQAVIAAYEGLLEPETPETVAIEVKTVVQSAELDALDLAKVQKLLALWQAELDRREEQDDEEALLMLL